MFYLFIACVWCALCLLHSRAGVQHSKCNFFCKSSTFICLLKSKIGKNLFKVKQSQVRIRSLLWQLLCEQKDLKKVSEGTILLLKKRKKLRNWNILNLNSQMLHSVQRKCIQHTFVILVHLLFISTHTQAIYSHQIKKSCKLYRVARTYCTFLVPKKKTRNSCVTLNTIRQCDIFAHMMFTFQPFFH